MDSLYSDPDGLLRCNLCGAIVGFCSHYSPFTGTPFEAPTYMTPPELPQGPLQPPVFDDLFVDFPEERPPAPNHTIPVTSPSLDGLNVDILNLDATTVTRETVENYLEDIYTPGYRTMVPEVEPAAVKPQQPPIRRQPPIPGGFHCTVKKCTRAFDRSCDLNRHYKSHLERNQRPHKCELCELRFLYPKDCKRHQQTHNPQLSRRTIFYCTVPGCINVDGFSRRDNLLRHMRNHHR
ncbi:hypothetical protein BU24DRAFT_405950 [Aaosphaeria arxii CBS 175.79]|uniref:C2H2-type domain-containing protein n=1 Tax=Aaosphaeria arxii CBS 175.79 TaxID=1450172 RepID=A0A6A5Y2X5_9PLEO|nr:uncharacterized protein BU24DRAFT_405950 [Aaosphaeria arxii CBS 175.79]KAF2019251.1 hypothetical protein BU24DRAFT_405950 [Aaosphaeria arxii CBS 175.79]